MKISNFSRSSATLGAQCDGSVLLLSPFETKFMFRCVPFATGILTLGKHHLPGETKKAEWKWWVFSQCANTVPNGVPANQKCYGEWLLKIDVK